MWFFAALPKEFSGSYTCTDFVVVMRPSMKTRSLFLMMLAMAASIFFRGCDLREKARMKPMPLCFKIAPMVSDGQWLPGTQVEPLYALNLDVA